VDPQQILTRLKAIVAPFSRGQLLTLALAFCLVVGIVASSAWWVKSPSYALLFSDMDADTAGQVITKLKTLKIAYQLDEGGRGIRVPADRVDELRIQLTSEGLPQSGRIGFEIFDRTQFGATEFLEQVNYRRALEGEIARTIATMSNVATARVHIAMGKDSLFGDPRPAKASVVLKLRGQRALPDSAVNGIGNLVAASVEGLRPEAVVILDSFGRPLARPQQDAADPASATQGSERQQRLEKAMADKVVALLEPVVGADHVRVNVSMKLNPSSLEETEELYDPNSVIRSQQSSADHTSSSSAAGQVAGSRGNMPVDPKKETQQPAAPGTAAAASAATAAPPTQGASRSSETTNYEISRKTRHVIAPPGDVARLSVAVIIDDDQVVKTNKQGEKAIAHKPRTHEELQKMQGLVAAAVGLEPTRGDQLTVENIAFDEPIVDEAPAPTMLQKIITPEVKEGSRMLVVVGIAVFALLFIVRPLLSRAVPQVVAAPHARAAVAATAAALVKAPEPGKHIKTVAEVESEIEAQLDANVTDKDRRLPVLTKRVTALSLNEPENIAKLLRTWMNENER
jgi:flagellar M-ring protein FliF